MRSFTEETGFFGNSDAEQLVREYGSPLYVYNENILRERMREMEGLIENFPFTANYSIKANSNLEILKIALEMGLNADAMSPGEILLLQKAGYPAEKIFFIPNNVSPDEMRFAVERGIILSIDSLSQLETFGKHFPRGKCAVRLNPGVGAGHNEKVVTAGKKTKFGIAEADLPQIFEIAKRYGLHIVGINQHVGSQILDTTPILEAVKNFLRLSESFDELEFIDFGGGFGIPYHKLNDEARFPLEEYKKELAKVLSDYAAGKKNVPLFKTEPGRYICAEGGVLLGRVHAVKTNSGKKYAGTDIGMNDLIRPELYDSWHDIEVIRSGKAVYGTETEEISVVGNICESGDIVAKERNLPKVEEGDIICVLDAGAYGYSMSSNYNMRLRPAEVLVRADGSHCLIRRRDTYEDLLDRFWA